MSKERRETMYIPLHTHIAEGSYRDSILKLEDYIAFAKRERLPALGLTDHGSLAMAYGFYAACKKEGIIPIIGCEVYEADDISIKDSNNRYSHLILLAKDYTGFQNLLKITARAHGEAYYYNPRTDLEEIRNHHEGLIALSACVGGRVPKKILKDPEDHVGIDEIIAEYHEIFGDDYYLEIQPGDFEEQHIVNQALIAASERTGVPLITTNDSHYLTKSDAYYHDACVKILYKKYLDDPPVYPGDSYYLMTEEDLRDAFQSHDISKDIIDRAIEKTTDVYEKCRLTLPEAIHMPSFLPDENEHKALAQLAYERLMDKSLTIKNLPKYSERLEMELDVIKELGYSGYFLSVYDFIQEAKRQNVAVGPGRGSAGGSLVSYVLGITLADPIHYNLMFERFLSPHRPGIPDIDLDFSSQDRHKLFLYAQEKYGEEHICLVSTVQRQKARTTLADTARIMRIPFREVEQIKELIPDVFYDENGDKNADIDIDFAIKNIPGMKRWRKRYPHLFDVSKKLENLPKNVSQHPAGIIISDEILSERIPMREAHKKTGINITSLDLDDAESMGFCKFDFLSLATIKVIDQTARQTVLFDFDQDDYNDPLVWDLLGTEKSSGLFQVSSPTYKKRMPKLKPRSIKELANCLALVRGPAISSGMDQLYIDILQGKKEPIKIHPFYDDATKDTHGVLIYQEQLMQIAVNFGFSLEEGYRLMKSAAKKRFDVLEGYKEQFYSHPDVDKKAVEQIFELVVNAGQYLFNSSHAVCYGLLTYASAWYKVYYPHEFYTNLLTNAYDRNKDYEIDMAYKEIKKAKITVLPSDINKSEWEFTLEDGKIRTGFVALKNLGEKAAQHVIDLRPIKDIKDLESRITRKTCDKRAVVSLILAGAFDSIKEDRIGLYEDFLTIRKIDIDLGKLKITKDKYVNLSSATNRQLEKAIAGKPL